MSLNLYQYHSEPESLYGFDQATEHVPHVAWNHYKGDVEELKKREHVWARSAAYSHRYADDVLEERFPEGEPAIATSAKYSHWYADDVLEERFPEGEPAIAESAGYSYLYALSVLSGRFLEGEPAIRGSEYQEDYEQIFGIKL
jgi:hypothetical protein